MINVRECESGRGLYRLFRTDSQDQDVGSVMDARYNNNNHLPYLTMPYFRKVHRPGNITYT